MTILRSGKTTGDDRVTRSGRVYSGSYSRFVKKRVAAKQGKLMLFIEGDADNPHTYRILSPAKKLFKEFKRFADLQKVSAENWVQEQIKNASQVDEPMKVEQTPSPVAVHTDAGSPFNFTGDAPQTPSPAAQQAGGHVHGGCDCSFWNSHAAAQSPVSPCNAADGHHDHSHNGNDCC